LIDSPDSPLSEKNLVWGRVMANIYAPVMRALVVAVLALATATLMVVAVNTARASGALMARNHVSPGVCSADERCEFAHLKCRGDIGT